MDASLFDNPEENETFNCEQICFDSFEYGASISKFNCNDDEDDDEIESIFSVSFLLILNI